MTSVRTVVGGALVLTALVSGCTGHGGTQQGFVSGDGAISVLKVADRKTPTTVRGPSLMTGRTLSLSAFRGKLVVVNVWGSWCPPCRSEAPGLVAAARQLARDNVVFLGIDTRDDEKAQPRAFVRRHKFNYDSIYDPNGETLLAFHGTLPLNAIPSTLIIDRQGRVAASVLDAVSETTLINLVQDVSRGKGT